MPFKYEHTHYSRKDASPAMMVSEEPFVLINEDGFAWADDPADWSTEPVLTDDDGEVLP